MPYLHPAIFTTTIAILLAFYLVWALARQQYLGVFQQFNLLCLSLISMITGILITQLLYPGYLDIPTDLASITSALKQPVTIVAILIGYTFAIGVSWRYIKAIHYPWWKVMDTNVLGLTLIAIGWSLGYLLAHPTIPIAVAIGALTLVFLGLLVAQQKVDQPGLIVGLHSLSMFAIVLGLQFALVSWHSLEASVEYLAGGIGCCIGIVIIGIVLRLRHRVSRTIPTTLPAGVSQKFRDTFAKALAPKQPSTKDGSTQSKSK